MKGKAWKPQVSNGSRVQIPHPALSLNQETLLPKLLEQLEMRWKSRALRTHSFLHVGAHKPNMLNY